MAKSPLQNSRLFDPYRWSTAPQVQSACAELRLLLGINDRRYDPYLVMFLLDLYCSWRSDPTQYICCSRDTKRYGKFSRYASIRLGYRCAIILMDKLRAGDYIDYEDSICYRDPVTKKIYAGYMNRIRATKKLIRLIVKHKVKLSMVSRHPNEAVIKFRTEKDEDDIAYDIKSFLVPRDVEPSVKVLMAYNELLQRSYVDLDDELVTDADIEKMRSSEYKFVEYNIDLSRKRVYRVFNNESWKNGGRIYGAWWHGCQKELRKYIIINGEPVVELDFSSIHVLLRFFVVSSGLSI